MPSRVDIIIVWSDDWGGRGKGIKGTTSIKKAWVQLRNAVGRPGIIIKGSS